MKVTKFYRVVEDWTVKNFSSWDLTIKYLQKYLKDRFDIVEAVFENGLEVTPLTEKAFNKICNTVIEDMINWNAEDTRTFFGNMIEIKEEEMEIE